MPNDHWTPENIAIVELKWREEIACHPAIGKIVHPTSSHASSGRMLCPSCGVVVYIRTLHSHRLSAQCETRQVKLQAMREGYILPSDQNSMSDVYQYDFAFPFKKRFLMRTGYNNRAAEVVWVKEWWYQLAAKVELRLPKDDMISHLSELALAYDEQRHEDVERIVGFLELATEH